MKRLRLSLALCVGLSAVAPATVSAEPPQPPPACGVVVTTPAASTGSSEGLANKMDAYTRVCGP
jgi:hypothetical protein